MGEMFIIALNLSISASLIILAVILFRAVLARKSHRAACLLWIVVALRLIVPFTPETDFGIMPTSNFVSLPKEVQTNDNVKTEIAINNELENGNYNVIKPTSSSDSFEKPGETISETSLDPTDNRAPLIEKTEDTDLARDEGNTSKEHSSWEAVKNEQHDNVPSEKSAIQNDDNADNMSDNVFSVTISILSYFWLFGIAIMLMYALLSYIRMRRVTAESLPENSYNLCDRINTPFILGIFKPIVFMPIGLSDDQCENVMAHERTHINRLDHVWKPLGFLLLSIYWFNPLMWIAYILLCKDIEFACDETVVSDMTPAGIKSYTETLLVCGINAHPALSCPLAFGEISVKERVKAVLNYKKPAFWIVLVALVVCIGLGILFMTKSAEDKSGDDQTPGTVTDTVNAVTGKPDDPVTDITETPTGIDNDVKQSKIDLGDLDLSKELSILELIDASKILESDSKKFYYWEKCWDSNMVCCDRYENDYLIQRDAVKWFKLFLTYFPSLKQAENPILSSRYVEKDSPVLTISSGTEPDYILNINADYVSLIYIQESITELPEALYFRYTDNDFVPDFGDIRRIFFQEKQYETYARKFEYTKRITEPGIYPSNTGYLIDLDGDGVEEKLFVAYCGLGSWAEPAKSWIENADTSRGYSSSYSGYTSNALIFVNGELQDRYSIGTALVMDCFAITDIDSTDGKFEILIDETDNVVDDYKLYHYNSSGKLVKQDFMWGFRYRLSVNEEVASYIRTQIPGDGCIYATRRLSILDGQFWDDCVWKLDKDGSILEITKMFYPWETMKKNNCADDEHKLKMEYPVLAFKEMNFDSERVRIEPGLVIPDMTDGIAWLHIISEDGNAAGWIFIDDDLEDEELNDLIIGYDEITKENPIVFDEDFLFSNLAHVN